MVPSVRSKGHAAAKKTASQVKEKLQGVCSSRCSHEDKNSTFLVWGSLFCVSGLGDFF